MRKEPFLPNCHYLIKNSGNNFETLFLEERNYSYFIALFEKHVGQIATLHAFRFFSNKFELLIKMKDISEIPLKYHDRMHQPFSNFFNAYCKAINKMYSRSGSLFREHFKRVRIDDQYVANLKNAMNESPVTRRNLVPHKIPNYIRPKKTRVVKSRFSINRLKIAASLLLAFLLNSVSASSKSFQKGAYQDTIAQILYTYLPKWEKIASKDSIIYPFEPFYDEKDGRYLAIGCLSDKQELLAINAKAKDSSITFYAYTNPDWEVVGKEKLPEFEEFVFEDLNADGRKELIARSGTNMNGNREYTIFHASAKTGKMEQVANFFGEFQLISPKKLKYFYEGSWYSDNIYAIYEWVDDKLVMQRRITLHPVNPQTSPRINITFEQNKPDGLKTLFSEKYNPKNKKHRYVVEHIDDDNFELK